MNSRKYIVIGESWLSITLDADKTRNVRPGGILLNAATALAEASVPTLFISEIGNDKVGGIIADYLTGSGVDISCTDRYGGLSSVEIVAAGTPSRYDIYADNEGFDIKWPRIEKEDVVIFGGYIAVDHRIRERLWSFLSYASERNATLIYIPGIDDVRIPRATKIMPTVYENLEIANVVVTLPSDLTRLYGTEDPAKAYKNNISFYCRNAVAITGNKESGYIASPFGEMKAIPDAMRISRAVADVALSIPMPEEP